MQGQCDYKVVPTLSSQHNAVSELSLQMGSLLFPVKKTFGYAIIRSTFDQERGILWEAELAGKIGLVRVEAGATQQLAASIASSNNTERTIGATCMDNPNKVQGPNEGDNSIPGSFEENTGVSIVGKDVLQNSKVLYGLVKSYPFNLLTYKPDLLI